MQKIWRKLHKLSKSCNHKQNINGIYNEQLHCNCLECAKFCGSHAIVGLAGLMLLYHRAFMGPKIFLVGILWVQNISSWVICGSEIFSHGYFVDSKVFLVGILWVQIFFLWVFCGSTIFSCGYFVCPRLYDFQ